MLARSGQTQSTAAITQDIPAAYARKLRLHQRVGGWLSRHPRALAAVSRIGSLCASIQADAAGFQRLEAHRRGDPLAGYTAPYHDAITALRYAAQLKDANIPSGESRALYADAIETLRAVLTRTGAPTVLNFGVCYAYVDAVLAREFPNVQFRGIDLTPHVAAINAAEFPDLPNLVGLSGDIFDELKRHDYRGGVLFHARTLLLLPRDFIEKLYAACVTAGIKVIVGYEQHGFSEETQTPYTFDTTERASVFWRNGMMIHNYPALAQNAGFRVIDLATIKTGHPAPDFSILRLVAERD